MQQNSQFLIHQSDACRFPLGEPTDNRFRERAVPRKFFGKTQHLPVKPGTVAPTDLTVYEEPVITANSTRSSYVFISTPTANRVGDDNELPRDEPLSSPRSPGQNDTSRPSETVRESRSMPLQPSYTNDLLSLLTMQRDANQSLLHQALESSALINPFFSDIDTLVHSLDSFMRKTEDFSATISLPEEQTTTLQGLQQQLQSLLNVDLPRCRTNHQDLDIFHRNTIETMIKANRELDRVLEAKPADLYRNLSPRPTLDCIENEVDLGGEIVARSPSVVQYLAQMGDIDAIQEKLTDLRLEHNQLREEQKTRERFGLSLDDESLVFLNSFQALELQLLDELEYAEVVLEALRQLVHDGDALQITNEAYNTDNGISWDLLSLPTAESTTPIPDSDSEVREEESLPFLSNLGIEMPTIAELYVTADTETSDSAKFINAWLLDRVRNQSGLLSKFTSTFEQYYAPLQPEDPLSLFLSLWFDDSTATDFQQSQTNADRQSMRANRANSRDPVVEGASSQTSQTGPIPLLTLGPGTKTEDIIAHAVRTRARTPLQDPG
ncbi:hypothetical protein H2200_009606 [Cladophialophora chaetospira]|uniref:Uncharacterized protein n=1 Tax=Cladophialophora chaetospira TaxID=386627 RepID=A0AA38X2V9_9EURO|nr:hypothetical protein H2200_009606 [Cladophialophora chaetospira]